MEDVTRTGLTVLLSKMSKQDLREAQDLLNAAWKRLNQVAALKIEKGMKVWFNDKYGQRREGIVVRVNMQSVTLDTKWRVPPDLLHVIG